MSIPGFTPGWRKEHLNNALKQLDLNSRHFKTLPANDNPPPAQGRVMLFERARQVLGKDIENVAQLIGDCVSFGAEHAVEYGQMTPILTGQLAEYKPIFPSYIYGVSRVLIGGQRGSFQDGSVGAWAAQGVLQYGVVSKDGQGVPEYSANVAKQYGAYGPPPEMVTLGQKHLIQSTAAVTDTKQLINSLWNGRPVTVASDIGYDMTARSDGFFYNTTAWGHQMCIIGAVWGYSNIPDHVCILNNWGDVHGKVMDMVTETIQWPVGTIRAHMADAQKALDAQDSFAYSQLVEGFPAAPLDPSLLNIF